MGRSAALVTAGAAAASAVRWPWLWGPVTQQAGQGRPAVQAHLRAAILQSWRRRRDGGQAEASQGGTASSGGDSGGAAAAAQTAEGDGSAQAAGKPWKNSAIANLARGTRNILADKASDMKARAAERIAETPGGKVATAIRESTAASFGEDSLSAAP